MKYLFFIAFIVVSSSMFYSCTSEFKTEDKVTLNTDASKDKIVDEIIIDLNLIRQDMNSNSDKEIAAQMDWLSDQLENGIDVDLSTFLSERLNVNTAVLERIKNYSAEKIAILNYENEHPNTDGLIYKRFGNFESDPQNPWTQKDCVGCGCTGDCDTVCGGWRPIRLVASLASCAAGGILACPFGIADLISFGQDGCMSQDNPPYQ